MSKRVVRNVFDPVVDKGTSWDIIGDNGEIVGRKKGRTKQSDKKGCDINFILDRYHKTGYLPDLVKKNPRYGDFSEVPDFQNAADLVAKAEEQFAALDAKTRKRFNNDPAEMLRFANDPANLEEMYKLGMAVRPPEPEPNMGVKASSKEESVKPTETPKA